MILTRAEILEILKENPHKEDVKIAQEAQKKLSVHVFGIGMDEYLEKINSFENPDQYKIRKKYARSNKDIIERVARPIDKIYSATGGSVFYDLPEKQNQEFRNRLRNIENGLTLRKWIEQYWKQAYLSDPMGLIFMEVDENGDAYPTYKGSNEIFTYQLNGRYLDYVVFNVEYKNEEKKEAKHFRVVDDSYDYLVEKDGEDIRIITEETFPNHFEKVPAILNSDIPVLGTDYFESPLNKAIEIADEYLREGSVKSVYKLLHGFPKAWEYQSQCTNCEGTGNVGGETCPVCKGTRVKPMRDVAEVRLIPIPEGTDVKIAPEIGGYITPPIEAWDKMTDELEQMESLIFKTIWGTRQKEEAENDTATGRFIDTQPINDRLSKFSEASELIEKFITDNLGYFYYGNNYKGSSVHYGRRFQIESPDVIWLKYENARKNGAPDTMLDDLLMDYVQSKYENNSLELQKQTKLLEIEPFPHLTAIQVKGLAISPIDYVRKAYFTEFAKTLTDNEIIFINTNTLQTKFTAYAEEKLKLINDEETRSNRLNQVETV